MHADRQVYGKAAAAAVKALKVITASQQHVFPLCARLELKFLLPVRCGSLLSRSGFFSFFFFFSGLLNCHPLKSRERVLLHQLHTLKPTHGPIAEAIKLSTSLSPSSSSPQMFSPSCFPPKFFITPSPRSSSSLPYSCGVRFVVSRAAGKRSQMLT